MASVIEPKSFAPFTTISAPLAEVIALSLGQPSRGLTRRSSPSPQFSIARADVPMFSPSCGSTRITAGPSAILRRRRLVPAILPPSRPPELVGEAVVEGEVGRVDHVGGDADGGPGLAAG